MQMMSKCIRQSVILAMLMYFKTDFLSIMNGPTNGNSSIAINKCSVLHISNNTPCHSYNLQSASLNNAIETTDLGIIVDNKLRFSSHYASIVRKARQRSSLILHVSSGVTLQF